MMTNLKSKTNDNSHPAEEKPHVRGRKDRSHPNPVDVHVGTRMRLRRQILEMSQQSMARKLGLTFQQVQKYEKGVNRIGASRLWDVAQVLQTSMEYFFEDMDKETEQQSPMMLTLPAGGTPRAKILEDEQDPMNREETLMLVRNYYKIYNRQLAKAIFKVIELMSKSNSTLPEEKGCLNAADIYENVDQIIHSVEAKRKK